MEEIKKIINKVQEYLPEDMQVGLAIDFEKLIEEKKKEVILKLYDLMKDEKICFYDNEDDNIPSDLDITFNWVESKLFKKLEL